jgi:hypothetical protein
VEQVDYLRVHSVPVGSTSSVDSATGQIVPGRQVLVSSITQVGDRAREHIRKGSTAEVAITPAKVKAGPVAKSHEEVESNGEGQNEGEKSEKKHKKHKKEHKEGKEKKHKKDKA